MTTQRNFRDLPIPSYFKMDGEIYQRVSKAKLRKFGNSQELTLRTNPLVEFLGEDINDFLESAIVPSR